MHANGTARKKNLINKSAIRRDTDAGGKIIGQTTR
jgi:hypothetical protein